MARFNKSTTEFWDTVEKEMMEIVIQNIEKENLLLEIDDALENAECELTELKDRENVVLAEMTNDNIKSSTMLFNSLLKKSALEFQSTEMEQADTKMNNEIISNNVVNISRTLATSSKLVLNNQLEETIHNCMPNFTSTPLKLKNAIHDQNGNSVYELQEISLYEQVNNDINLSQTDSCQFDNIFTKDVDCCNLMMTIKNNLCQINDSNNIELNEDRINDLPTPQVYKYFQSDNLNINIIGIKSKTDVCTEVNLDDNFKINIANDLYCQNNMIDLENNDLDNIHKENLNINCNDLDALRDNITVIEAYNKTFSNLDDECIVNKKLYQNKVLPSNKIKLINIHSDKNVHKIELTGLSNENNFEFQQKIDNAEMNFNVSDLKIDLPLHENEQEIIQKRPACEEYSNENKRIKLNEQIENENLEIANDDSFAQDVTVENFTKLIFESQKTIDENDPNWRNIHDLSTAEDYFKYVGYQWQSETLPDPQSNLSKIFVPCPKSLQSMQNPQICNAETKNLIQQAIKNIGEINKLDKNKSEFILINKFYYAENGERDAQLINKNQCEDLIIQEKLLEFQKRFYK